MKGELHKTHASWQEQEQPRNGLQLEGGFASSTHTHTLHLVGSLLINKSRGLYLARNIIFTQPKAIQPEKRNSKYDIYKRGFLKGS